MKSRFTLGQKIAGCSIVIAAVTGAFAVSSLIFLRQVGQEFEKAAQVDALKMELAERLTADVADMLSDERGVLLRTRMNEMSAAQRNEDSFEQVGRNFEQTLDQLRPLLVTDQGKRDVAELTLALNSAREAQRQVWSLGRGKKVQDATGIYEKSLLPLEPRMKALTGDLTNIQKSLIAADMLEAQGNISRDRWLTLIVIAIFAIAGVVTNFVMRGSVRRLGQMAQELDDSRSQVASAASQVASSSQSLAQGASEQAASLEQTAASVEEIASMVRKNADNSHSVAALMEDTEKLVKDGNRTLEQMVISMHEIKASSDKISKIIKVIDEIAFQTNILALNAAVEAARAGEAGMGFAVVADEVRNLAQRSAQAAKDTAALIEESIAKSHEGSSKLQQVTDVIRAITDSSGKVKVLVDEVSLGSQEQARGIDEISKSIQQMNQLTQSTAAGAEESASASEELSAQAATMGEAVEGLRALLMKTDPPPHGAQKKNPFQAKTAMIEAPAKPLSNRSAIPLEDEFTEI